MEEGRQMFASCVIGFVFPGVSTTGSSSASSIGVEEVTAIHRAPTSRFTRRPHEATQCQSHVHEAVQSATTFVSSGPSFQACTLISRGRFSSSRSSFLQGTFKFRREGSQFDKERELFTDSDGSVLSVTNAIMDIESDVSAEDAAPAVNAKEASLLANEELNKPSLGERARTLAQLCDHGTLTTSSTRHGGWPFGSFVDYVLDDNGRPVFCLSYFATHTANLQEDQRCSLFLHPPSTSAQADSRVTLMGKCSEVGAEEVEDLRGRFLSAHGHYGEVSNFNNFRFYRMDVAEVYYVAGFGSTARWVDSTDYLNAEPDVLLEHAAVIVTDFNKNRGVDLRLIAAYWAGWKFSPEDTIVMKSIDRLGFDIRGTISAQVKELRIPFKTPHDRPVSEKEDAQSTLTHMALEAWEFAQEVTVDTPVETKANRNFKFYEEETQARAKTPAPEEPSDESASTTSVSTISSDASILEKAWTKAVDKFESGSSNGASTESSESS